MHPNQNQPVIYSGDPDPFIVRLRNWWLRRTALIKIVVTVTAVLLVAVPVAALFVNRPTEKQMANKPGVDHAADDKTFTGDSNTNNPTETSEEPAAQNTTGQDITDQKQASTGSSGSTSSGGGASNSGGGGNTGGQQPSDPGNSGPQPAGVAGSWSLVFQDEFSGGSLDTSKWSNCWFPQSGCGSMNNVTTSASNVAVSNGNLVLTLASSSSGALVSSDPAWGAKPGFQFRYGVAEARIYFPGNGTNCYNWPAWWTNGQSWPANGENDIAEVLGGKMTVNYHSSSGSANQGAVPGYWCGGFHTYTMHRKAGSVDIYYDGTKVKSYTTNDAGAMHYLILNVGYSANYPVYGAASQVRVDYVRVWQ